MRARELHRIESRLEAWLSHIFGGLGRPERVAALEQYLQGLLLEGERKSISPIARRLVEDPSQAEAMRQRIQQAVVVAKWDAGLVFERIAVAAMKRLPGIDALVLDDTGFPKKGYKSVGVQRQYSGTMGRIDNCQVATSLHLASEQGGVCIGMRLYMPAEWIADDKRRRSCGVPPDLAFQEKWRIGLHLIDEASAYGIADRVIVADAGYGDASRFRAELAARGHKYIVGVTGTAVAWPPGVMPTPPPPRAPGTRGRPRTRWTAGEQKPRSMNEIAASLPSRRFRKITWREGTRGPQSSRFAAVRIRTAHRHHLGRPPGDELWLLSEAATDHAADVPTTPSSRPPTHDRNLSALLSANESARATSAFADLIQ